MTRLARLAPLGRRDAGAVTSIVAVLLGGGVIMGCAALSVDVGSIMFERRQLQNGADASAVALARACAKAPASCAADSSGAGTVTKNTLTRLNNINNNKDSLGGFDPAYNNPPVSSGGLSGLCGSSTTMAPGLQVCPTPTNSVTDCTPVPATMTSLGIPYVEVHTITAEAGATPTILPNAISRLVTGGSTGQSVKACSRAAWGAPASGHAGIPITLSGCDWRNATGGNLGGGGGSYYPGPVYSASAPNGYGSGSAPSWPGAALTPPAMNAGNEVILMIQNPSGGGSQPLASPCPNWQGHTLPGGFGLLETVASNPCAVLEYPYNWVHTNSGSSTACDLNSSVGKLISLPIFNCSLSSGSAPTSEVLPADPGCSQGNGSNAWYHRQGYATFYLSGFNITTTSGVPNHAKSLVSGNYPCSGGASCISGWFVSGELSATALAGPPSGTNYFGSYAVVPAG